ncbi:MAG: YDG domain-containing protein, partial [Acidobacteriaceae bacterium]|nr:YDG domain-containing protein [Acidobacteriaceae bacterium]
MAILAAGFVAPARAQVAAQFSYGGPIPLGGGFSDPYGVAVDSGGNVFVADHNNGVLEIPASCIDGANNAGCTKTLGKVGSNVISTAYSVAVDGSGNVYATDSGHNLWQILGSCLLNTATDPSTCGATPVGLPSGPNKASVVAVDGSGVVYIVDNNGSVWKLQSGSATQLGSGFSNSSGITVDRSGNVYIANQSYTDPNVYRLQGGCGVSSPGSATCPATQLGNGFTYPRGVAVDSSGNVFVGDNGSASNNALKEIPASCISTATPSTCTPVTLAGPSSGNFYGVAVDGSGNVYVADNTHYTVTKYLRPAVDFGLVAVGSPSASMQLTFSITTGGTLGAPQALTMGAPNLDFAVDSATAPTCTGSVTAGQNCTVNVIFTPKYAGLRMGAVVLYDDSATPQVVATALVHGIGTGPQVAFNAPMPATLPTLGSFTLPQSIAVDGAGNVYVTEAGGVNTVKKIAAGCMGSSCPSTTLSTSGDFNSPVGVAVDGAGNVYVADYGNNAVKEIAAGCTGSCPSITLSTSGDFNRPMGVAVDGAGNVYVADMRNSAVKEIAAGCTGSCPSTTLSTSGDFTNPDGVAVDGAGNVYIADGSPGVVKKIAAGCTGSCPSITLSTSGDFISPVGVAVDGAGNVYVAALGNGAVKEIAAGCTGSCSSTTLSTSGDFANLVDVAVDGAGNVYVADSYLGAVKELPRATPPTLTFDTTGGASTNGPVVLQNIGADPLGNDPLTFAAPGSGTNPLLSAGFTLDTSLSTACPVVSAGGTPGTLASGASCTIQVDYGGTGVFSGLAVPMDDSLNAAAPNYATQPIPLMVGTGSWLTIAPATMPETTYGQSFSAAMTAVLPDGTTDPNNYVCSNGGSMAFPAGYSVGMLSCTIGFSGNAGSAISAGSWPVVVSVYDAASPMNAGTQFYMLKVNPAPLTVTLHTGNKTYDSSADATALSTCSLGGVVSGDDIVCTVTSASFDDASVGGGKTVTAEVSIAVGPSGNGNLGNYSLA